MPRDFPSALITLMQSDTWNPAILVKVVLADGAEQGYTSADVEIDYDGLTYFPEDGIKMTALALSLGLVVDNSQSSGFLEEGRFDKELLNRRAFENAEYTVMICDWSDIGAGAGILSSGTLGRITTTDDAFTADHVGIEAFLKRIRGDVTTKKCRCRQLGDVCCKLNLAGNVQSLGMGSPRPIQVTKSVDSVTSQKIIVFASEAAPATFFTYGLIEFTSGANTGIKREVKSHTLVSGKARLETVMPFPFAIANGDTAILTAGCNRKLKYDLDASKEPRIASTCQEFGNGGNHHGEHMLPGNDAITQVAGTGQ